MFHKGLLAQIENYSFSIYYSYYTIASYIFWFRKIVFLVNIVTLIEDISAFLCTPLIERD